MEGWSSDPVADHSFFVSGEPDARPPAANGQSPRKVRMRRGEGPEAQRVVNRLAGFDLGQSAAWKAIVDQFTIGVTHAELKSIAQVVCGLTRLQIDQDPTRDNRVLIKWFSENWDAIGPVMQAFHLRDDEQNIIAAHPTVALI
jgi:hypothetical protein